MARIEKYTLVRKATKAINETVTANLSPKIL